ncbi:tellurite resistance/C4-dicarboxylate transporter family protein [Nocardia brasiliensis]|uniref:tellurite resistance/C4-dicarboxylate transporter family protein n=1 Tax=Nocardia brasiliensis TaxID=37326 RepID=UPI0037B22198
MAQRWWRELPPAAGSFVMATGIVSIGLHLIGFEVVSWVLLALAVLVWLLLVFDFAERLLRNRSRWIAEADTPPALTGVAATTVLGSRIAQLGLPDVSVVLLVAAMVLWPLLLHGVLRHTRRRMPGVVFLVCVSTQGLAVLTSTLALAGAGDWLILAASVFFSLGLLLYIGALVHFDVEQVWTGAGDQWIATGALAISALAASKLVAAQQLTGGMHWLLRVVALLVLGLNLSGYAVLMIAEIVRPRPGYDIRRWATVFPLGMTAVATLSTGAAVGVPALHLLGELLLVVAVGAWVLTFAVLLTDRSTFQPHRA